VAEGSALSGLLDDVRSLLVDVLGKRGAATGMTVVQARRDAAVLVVSTVAGQRLVVKVAGPQAEHPVAYMRSAMLTGLARAAQVPVPEVLAADDSGRLGRWRFLIAEYIDGTTWRDLRPQLTAEEVVAAHEQLAVALVAVQALDFRAFGELGTGGKPPVGQGLLPALHERAELRIGDGRWRASFHELLDREALLFADEAVATLTHDDLHHGNLLFRRGRDRWRLVGILDWDKAWAGPPESDVARMAFWDDMTGPGFWQSYRRHVPASEGQARRALIYQLLWCFEDDDGSARHASDTARLRHRLHLP
jgi:aminoglycoside phosphotransferase (APT) family kinase protein